MKKSLFVLPLAAGLLVIPAIGQQKTQPLKVHADDLETSIEMTSDFFTNWSSDAGQFKAAGASCWSGPMNAFGSFFDGCNDGYEGWTGTLNSRKWRQTTNFLYFEWGCASDINRDNPGQQEKMMFHLYQNEDDVTPYKSYEYWNDTFSGCTMMIRNFHINDEDYATLNGDFYMSVDLIDERTGDYGAHEFGYLHVNQTHQQVSDAEWYYYTHCVDGERTVQQLRDNFFLNWNLRDGFVTGFSESFDTQESFNTNWMLDNYGDASIGERHPDRAISHSTYRAEDGNNMPYNNTDGFFKGWYGGGDQDVEGDVYGYVADDNPVYRFVSKPFRLPENGLVSVKMAGNSASLHLIDFDGGHGDLAWVDVKSFNPDGDLDNIALSGKNTCTMVRHIANFSKYAGRLVQIGIADVDSKQGGWNAVYFDELKADYVEIPTLKVDAVAQNSDGVNDTYSHYPDIYVNAVEGDGGVDYAFDDGPDTDDSPLKVAYDFISNYFAIFRNVDTYFSFYQQDHFDDLYTGYLNLNDDVRSIVANSMDFDHGNRHYILWYYAPVRIYDNIIGNLLIGNSINYLASYYLEMAVNEAKEFLDLYKADVEYKEAQQEQRQQIIDGCKNLLDSITSYSDKGQIDEYLAEAVSQIDSIPVAAQVDAQEVVDLIDEIPEITRQNYAETKLLVEQANDAYEALSQESKSYVINYYKLIGDINTIADVEVAIDIDQQIADIGEVTLQKEQQVLDVKQAYDALTTSQNLFVLSRDVLEAAIAKIDELIIARDAAYLALNAINPQDYYPEDRMRVNGYVNQALEDIQTATSGEQINQITQAALDEIAAIKTVAQHRAEDLDEQINNLPAVSDVQLSDEAAIIAARNAYDALDDAAKGYVQKLEILEALEARILDLKQQKQHVEEVEAKINAIGNIDSTKATYNRIKSAELAYSTLTEEEKAMVSNKDVLDSAISNFATALSIAIREALHDVEEFYSSINMKKYSDENQDAINNLYQHVRTQIEAQVYSDDLFDIVEGFKDEVNAIPKKKTPAKKGCGGSIVVTSVILSTLALAGLGLAVSKKRKED